MADEAHLLAMVVAGARLLKEVAGDGDYPNTATFVRAGRTAGALVFGWHNGDERRRELRRLITATSVLGADEVIFSVDSVINDDPPDAVVVTSVTAGRTVARIHRYRLVDGIVTWIGDADRFEGDELEGAMSQAVRAGFAGRISEPMTASEAEEHFRLGLDPQPFLGAQWSPTGGRAPATMGPMDSYDDDDIVPMPGGDGGEDQPLPDMPPPAYPPDDEPPIPPDPDAAPGPDQTHP